MPEWSWGVTPAGDVENLPTGWFAILHSNAEDFITLGLEASCAGVQAANTTMSLGNSADAGSPVTAENFIAALNTAVSLGLQAADTTMTMTDSATLAGVLQGNATDLALTDSAVPVGVLSANNDIVLVNSGDITDVIAYMDANNTIPIINAGIVVGYISAAQAMDMISNATASAILAADDTFTMDSSATYAAAPGADLTFTMTDSGDVVGVVNAQNDIAMTSSADAINVGIDVTYLLNFSGNPATVQPTVWETILGTPACTVATGYFSAGRSTMVTDSETATDKVLVESHVSTNGSGKSGIIMFSSLPYSGTCMYLELETGAFTNRLQFKSRTTTTDTGTTRGTPFNYQATTGHLITAKYDPADSTFRGYVNGVERTSYVNAGLITVGAGRRHHGLQSNFDNNSGERWTDLRMADV